MTGSERWERVTSTGVHGPPWVRQRGPSPGVAAGAISGAAAAILGMSEGVILGVAAGAVPGMDGTILHPDHGHSLMTAYMYEYSEKGQCV